VGSGVFAGAVSSLSPAVTFDDAENVLCNAVFS
jgi:hypothetical protein